MVERGDYWASEARAAGHKARGEGFLGDWAFELFGISESGGRGLRQLGFRLSGRVGGWEGGKDSWASWA